MATEKRLIDAIALISKARRMETTDNNGIPVDTFAVPVMAIEDAPTVDSVEVVRCKDCKHAEINENHPNKPLICYLTRMCGTVKPDWYCWQGGRKDND